MRAIKLVVPRHRRARNGRIANTLAIIRSLIALTRDGVVQVTEMTALMKLSMHESMIDVDLRCDAKAVRTMEADFFKETDESVVSAGDSVERIA